MRLLIVLCCLLAAAVARADEVRIGVLAYQGSERAARDFEPTVAQLRRTLPEHRFTLQPLDAAGLAAAVGRGELDFVVTNPGYYVELESAHGVTRLATLESREHAVPTDSVGSTVVVPNRPGHAERFEDLAGRRVAVVAADAFGGWRVVWREMAEAGVEPTRLAALVETGFPMERVIDALRTGRADAGVLRTCLLEELIAAGRVRADEFAVVGERPAGAFPCRLSSRLYPDWPFARLAGTSPDLAKAVTASLLTMAPVDGRAWTAPQDYSSVHALFRTLKIGPYEYLSHTTLRGLVAGYWPWFAAAAAALAWWLVHVARVESLVRRRTVELTREIQEREKAEQAARLHREQRDQFSRLGILGEMASNIAHELNQPLAAITNYAEGMTRYIDAGRTDTAFLRDGARGIAGQAERAAVIIRRIRGFVRRRDARREPLDLDLVVRETLPLFAHAAARRGIPLLLRLDGALPPVQADRIEIEQVLLNLLQNALDATPDGVAHERGIVVTTAQGVAGVELAVRDHGSGLPPEVQARLFDPFFTTKPQGLGLGLSICRTIVESHGGRLTASAEADGGATMRVVLPPATEEPR
ncbi:sensor histidine kinase [Rubrivivax gelatinosus]|uniref:histidine kinase n=1 Tax=Rubrivivax gelatinosus (strain NBRC 100245 / IL144) TaxID=983917 RepID=I0HT85_RUBGI|nr:PhnD/SsuA/transferrin family substrate-binding protein [Rubrivivax gelatinosus]BAL96222.1 histidine kinase [Rubrivivax gelatinosus IL144]